MAQLGDGGGSGYPGAIDTSTVEKNDPDPNATVVDADKTNGVTDAIIKIQAELGIDPAGADITLLARLANMDTELAPIESGTEALFFQAAAPTGWTQNTTHNDKAFRVVSWTGGGTGGSVAFETAFTSQNATGTVGDTAITTAQTTAHVHRQNQSSGTGGGFLTGVTLTGSTSINGDNTDSTGSGSVHTHSFSG